MAYYVWQRGEPDVQHVSRLLPEGFTHTFLIREPRRAIKSLYKMSIDKRLTGSVPSRFDSLSFFLVVPILISRLIVFMFSMEQNALIFKLKDIISIRLCLMSMSRR